MEHNIIISFEYQLPKSWHPDLPTVFEFGLTKELNIVARRISWDSSRLKEDWNDLAFVFGCEEITLSMICEIHKHFSHLTPFI